jgi:hypothetical protein
VRIPRGFRTSVISLSTLTGVGLIYRYTVQSRSPAGWTLCVWDESGKMLSIPRWIVVAWTATSAPGIKRRYFAISRNWSLPLAHEDSAYLAASKPGRTATRIYEAALTWQGRLGPLTTRALEKTVVFDPDARTQMAAWWSPDGTMGRAQGLSLPQLVPGEYGGWSPSRSSGPTPTSPIAVPVASPEVQRARRATRNRSIVTSIVAVLIPVLVLALVEHSRQSLNGPDWTLAKGVSLQQSDLPAGTTLISSNPPGPNRAAPSPRGPCTPVHSQPWTADWDSAWFQPGGVPFGSAYSEVLVMPYQDALQALTAIAQPGYDANCLQSAYAGVAKQLLPSRGCGSVRFDSSSITALPTSDFSDRTVGYRYVAHITCSATGQLQNYYWDIISTVVRPMFIQGVFQSPFAPTATTIEQTAMSSMSQRAYRLASSTG